MLESSVKYNTGIAIKAYLLVIYNRLQRGEVCISEIESSLSFFKKVNSLNDNIRQMNTFVITIYLFSLLFLRT